MRYSWRLSSKKVDTHYEDHQLLKYTKEKKKRMKPQLRTVEMLENQKSKVRHQSRSKWK